MPDLEKEKQVVLVIETAQLELKKIIKQGILLDLPKEQLKLMTIDLINEVKVKMRDLKVDEQFIQETEFAIKRSFILWYNNLYAQLKKTQYNETSRIYHGDEQKTKPIITDNTGGFVIDSGLKREKIENIREFQTIYDEGSAGYYYNYTERVAKALNELAQQHLTTDKNSLRNKAEIKVRYDVINEDLQRLKDKGVKVHYKIISNIINEELADMVELREMRRGYRLTAPIEDVERVLLRNIIVSRTELFSHNNVISVITSVQEWISCITYKKNRF